MIKGTLQDSDGDLLLQNGDFVTGDATQDIVGDTILAIPGDYKSNPLFGAGLRRALGGKPDVYFNGKLRAQLKAQGITVNKISFDENEGTISVEI